MRDTQITPPPEIKPVHAQFWAEDASVITGTLQSGIRQKRHQLRHTSGKVLSRERVGHCGRTSYSPRVDVWRSKHGAHFTGVVTCGSVWVCPVCAAKITERRREEVAHAIETAYGEGGAAYMVTLTIPHYAFDRAGILKTTVAEAWRHMTKTRGWRNAKSAHGVFGFCRALEVTHGQNGWHPHLHALLFTEKPLDGDAQEALRLAIFDQWSTRVKKDLDRECSPDACDLRPATKSDYLTKWAADRELTKMASKDGKGGRSPWQVLDDYHNFRMDRDRKLWIEYGLAFKGAKHLTWSNGLKDRLGVHEMAEQEIAEHRDETVQEDLPLDDGLIEGRIGSIDRDAWKAICHEGLTAAVLDAAHMGGWAAVVELLADEGIHIEGEPPPRQPPRTPPTPKNVRLQAWEWDALTGGKLSAPNRPTKRQIPGGREGPGVSAGRTDGATGNRGLCAEPAFVAD